MKAFCGLIILYLLSLSSIALAAETITIAADAWPPFNGEPKSESEGYMIDIAREAFGAAGYEVDYKILSWKRALNLTREGEIDGVVGASKRDAQVLSFLRRNWRET